MTRNEERAACLIVVFAAFIWTVIWLTAVYEPAKPLPYDQNELPLYIDTHPDPDRYVVPEQITFRVGETLYHYRKDGR